MPTTLQTGPGRSLHRACVMRLRFYLGKKEYLPPNVQRVKAAMCPAHLRGAQLSGKLRADGHCFCPSGEAAQKGPSWLRAPCPAQGVSILEGERGN